MSDDREALTRAQDRPANVETLVGQVQGPVFLPGDDGYDAERAGYQTGWRHQPAVIVGAASADDVCAAIAFASVNGLPMAVQGVGHGLAVPAVGGLLISTRRMTAVRVDAEARTAWFEAGVRWEQVIQEAASHGLAPLSGSAPGVGAVAYTLGGGLGLLARRYGYAADHVNSIDVVTADAQLRHVTAESDPDLFWAMRGGRDNFGVATGMEVALFPVAQLYGGGLFFDANQVGGVLEAYLDWTGALPDEMTTSVALIPFPNIPVIPEPIRGRYVANIRIAYIGDTAEGERLVAPLRALGPRLLDTLAVMPYAAAGSIYNDPTTPDAFYGSNALLNEFNGAAAQTVLDLAGPSASVPCIVEARHLGGALARPPSIANAVGRRDARYLLRVFSPRALGASDVNAIRAAHQRLFTALDPWTIGRSLNFLNGENDDAEEVRAAYDSDAYLRLRQLKAVYDPTNLFRFNTNIPPAAG